MAESSAQDADAVFIKQAIPVVTEAKLYGQGVPKLQSSSIYIDNSTDGGTTQANVTWKINDVDIKIRENGTQESVSDDDNADVAIREFFQTQTNGSQKSHGIYKFH